MDHVPQTPSAFDAHTHLDFPAFDEDRDAVVARARSAGVDGWVIAGADPAHWDRIDRIAQATGGIPCHGVHPWWLPDLDDETIAAAIAALRTRETSGIGETGLDRRRATTQMEQHRQEAALRAHIEIARDRALPLVLHCVGAYPRLLDILEEKPGVKGMIHSWSGPPELVARATALGLYISIGATVTRSAKVCRSAAAVPSAQLLLETDCPDQPIRRDERGEPAHLMQIAEHVAKVRDSTVSDLLISTRRNAMSLFGVAT